MNKPWLMFSDVNGHYIEHTNGQQFEIKNASRQEYERVTALLNFGEGLTLEQLQEVQTPAVDLLKEAYDTANAYYMELLVLLHEAAVEDDPDMAGQVENDLDSTLSHLENLELFSEHPLEAEVNDES